MTTNYLRLNNLFPSDMDIIAVKKYKRTGEFPALADTDRKRAAFKAKYQFFDISKDHGSIPIIFPPIFSNTSANEKRELPL